MLLILTEGIDKNRIDNSNFLSDRLEARIDLNNKSSEHSQLSESSGDDNKSWLCIGNIFRLDVSGTLKRYLVQE